MASSARGHKRNRSSGDLDQSRILEFETLMERISGQIGDLKKHREFGELEEVQSLAEITESVCNQVRYFKELRAKDSNPNAIVVPLSSVDHDTLEDRLGIKFVSKFESAGSSPEKVLESVRAKIPRQDFGNFEVIRQVVREWDLSHLSKMLNMHSNYVNQKSEASARMVIDNWLMSCLGIAMNANAGQITVLIPELLVWSSKASAEKPPRIEYGDPGDEKVTYLSGSVDYATLNVQSATDWRSAQALKTYVWNLVNEENAARRLSRIKDYRLEHTIVLHEAKRQDKVLSNHVPQAVAQCVALSTKMDRTEPMAFTLTSGSSWIFGIVNARRRKYSMTAEVEILDGSKPDENRLRALMELILIWTTQPANVLEDIMINEK